MLKEEEREGHNNKEDSKCKVVTTLRSQHLQPNEGLYAKKKQEETERCMQGMRSPDQSSEYLGRQL
jgi:hypothetical protein